MFSPEERQTKIDSYGAAPARLTAALEKLPRTMWQFRPAPGEWSIHEIIIHIADSEVNSYVRCRRFLAEPGSTVLGYDEGVWARTLNYHAQNPDDALALFSLLRQSSYLLIKDQPASVWSNTVIHSENGPMTLDDWLRVYEQHIPNHIAQMENNYAVWKP